MNGREKPPEDSNLNRLLRDSRPTKEHSQIAELEEDLEGERKARKRERFLWAGGLLILFDSALFTLMPSWGGPIALLVLQLLFILVIARMLGVEEVVILINRMAALLNWPNGRHD